MHSETGKNIITSFRQKWVRNSILSLGFISLACSFLSGMLLHKLLFSPLSLTILFFFILTTFLLLLKRPWQVQNKQVVSFLNGKYPELEESCGLLLKNSNELSLLETLQADRTLAALQQITKPKEFIKSLRTSILTLLAACIVGLALAYVPMHFNMSSTTSVSPTNTNTPPEKILPGISAAAITITPPVYTKHSAKQQQQFNIRVEEGALVQWTIQTTTAVKKIQLLFNDSSKLLLQAQNDQHTQWQISKKIAASGFYQVALDSSLSEFYKIEVIKDQPPVIAVTSPKPNITIEYGEPQRININVNVTDDYGVKNAAIFATTASGSGEAVKFKEQTIQFPNSFNGQLTQYQLQKMVDLAAMGMQPADELYFYIKAVDNNSQEKRSDIYIVTLADTAQLMESDVLLGNVKLKPEYFRSERQIIIETEQLLKDKDTITPEEFKNRSNNLGIDQKLLRLRYGKFLGEENESGEGVADNNNTLSDPTNFGNANAIIDAYSDKHDNAEDATFFTDDIKQQLKATLTEMWNAEIKLRTFKPQEALPFEYKALRLLKDLQQKSRAYVPKTTFKTTPLKPEKRLTGDLSKIIQPETQANIPKQAGANETIAAALSILEQLKFTAKISGSDEETLQQAMQLLGNQAAIEPAAYLQGYQSLKKIAEVLQSKNPVIKTDIQNAEQALQKMITAPDALPQKNNAGPYNQLQQQYFKTLQKNKGN